MWVEISRGRFVGGQIVNASCEINAASATFPIVNYFRQRFRTPDNLLKEIRAMRLKQFGRADLQAIAHWSGLVSPAMAGPWVPVHLLPLAPQFTER